VLAERFKDAQGFKLAGGLVFGGAVVVVVAKLARDLCETIISRDLPADSRRTVGRVLSLLGCVVPLFLLFQSPFVE
jgi:hypothetical protein